MSVATASSPAVGSFLSSRSQRRSTPGFRMALRSDAVSVSVSPILTKLKHKCATPLPVLQHVADAMSAAMRAGLTVDGGAGLPMIPTYVDNLPTGYLFLSSSPLVIYRIFAQIPRF